MSPSLASPTQFTHSQGLIECLSFVIGKIKCGKEVGHTQWKATKVRRVKRPPITHILDFLFLASFCNQGKNSKTTKTQKNEVKS